MRRDATNTQRTFRFALLAIISLFVTSQALAVTIQEDFTGYTATATINLSAIVPATNTSAQLTQVQLTSIQPSVLSTPHRNARTARTRSYRFASLDSDRIYRNKRSRRTSDPIVRTVVATNTAILAVPDSGNTVLLMGGALAVLLSVRALRPKKLAH